MAPTQIFQAPTFTTVRSVAGAIAVDNVTINDTNYPPASAVQPPAGSKGMQLYWYASGGTVAATDWVDLQLLYRDAKNPVAARWIEGPSVRGVRQHQVVQLPTRGNSQCYVRVLGFSCAAGTGLRVMAATVNA